MNKRKKFMLFAMSPAGTGSFSPVQVQKLLFLLDENVAAQTGGPHFSFEPYDYGPFDKDVYLELEKLHLKGLVEILMSRGRGSRIYKLTDKGFETGKGDFEKLPEDVRRYIREAVSFVRGLSFAELVSAIYEAYPEMRVNSVFFQEGN